MGRGEEPPHIKHIRLRARSKETEIQNVRNFLKKELDTLQQNGKIAEHYCGNHGKPNEDYRGEGCESGDNNFDENEKTPEGWNVVQKWLEAGSEIELIFLKNRLRGVQLGPRFVVLDLLHFFANQCEISHRVNKYANETFMIFQLD